MPEDPPEERTQRMLSVEEVHAHLEVDSAIAAIAASPLDQDRIEEMRRILAGPQLRSARAVLSRLNYARGRRHLSVVEPPEADDGMSPEGDTR